MTTLVRDTRSTILAAASELFRKQGYASTSMGQVADLAGMSKGNLTYHFPSKLALFEAVHEQVASYVRERLIARSFDEAPEAIAGVEGFTRRLRRWCLDADGHFIGCWFTNLAIEAQHGEARVRELSRAGLAEVRALLTARIEAGQRAGEVRMASGLATQLFWMYEGALALSRATDDPAEYDAFCRSLRGFMAP